ncbi:MAG: alpha-hydroxy-acid oxidizing protein [Chloroflexi bacterium]|nr:alpha-hydroxy-acid oxidizing protein [Chloroflexota bacterium]
MSEFLTIPEIIHAAEEKLPRPIWDFASGGAETETTLRRNRLAMERYALCQRVLVDVRKCDFSTTFLNHRLSIPVMLAPVGSLTRFAPDGALAAARVAERKGTIAFVSTVSAPSLETVAAGVDGPAIFQLYNYGDRDWVKSIVRRVENAGYCALCLTADTAMYGRRERDLHNRFFPRQVASDRPNLADVNCTHDEAEVNKAGMTWEYLAWLRDQTRLPLILKGVMMADDAARAVEAGVEAIYVSNHGGRQLDHGLATIEVLPEIVQAVAGRAEVLVDSGFVRGTDVIKGLALGAKAVAIGKLMSWGLAADGEAGLERALDLLAREIEVGMALIGATSVAEIGPHVIRPTMPLG